MLRRKSYQEASRKRGNINFITGGGDGAFLTLSILKKKSIDNVIRMLRAGRLLPCQHSQTDLGRHNRTIFLGEASSLCNNEGVVCSTKCNGCSECYSNDLIQLSLPLSSLLRHSSLVFPHFYAHLFSSLMLMCVCVCGRPYVRLLLLLQQQHCAHRVYSIFFIHSLALFLLFCASLSLPSTNKLCDSPHHVFFKAYFPTLLPYSEQ